MGCCGSKHSTDGQDESQRLLDGSNDPLGYGPTRMVSATQELNQVRELESLQKIVERTAGNLIDIPSTFHLERLQQQEAETRSNEYLSALNTVKLPEQTLRKLSSMTSVNVKSSSGVDLPGLSEVLEQAVGLKGSLYNNGCGLGAPRERTSTSSGSSVKAPSVREVLAEKTVDPKTVGWMANVMGELQQATESMDVEDVGDLIVTLSPPVVR
ncbi:hypothetical protein EMPS_00474 [Entomortierella parvispora]|uniref:Late endosomal/lysosomal adaptor and MAPK and MTOR activator 1 n=1 Tax=Entomortierella parvispora TaxID=205924 RepID=A0A9P3H1Q4_9FUNG|nr:hypothetical protein EMPS_00474 [Entomortierella parvispora]